MRHATDGPVDIERIRVEDLMVRDVITVRAEMTVSELVKLLDFEQISGAPVVDGRGRLIGVASVTDVVRLVAHAPEVSVQDIGTVPQRREDPDEALLSYFVDPDDRFFGEGERLAAVSESVLDDYAVRDIMTPATFTVRADATLPELARFLVRGRIHRSFVVEGDRLVGIVTAYDVVRAVAGELGPEVEDEISG